MRTLEPGVQYLIMARCRPENRKPSVDDWEVHQIVYYLPTEDERVSEAASIAIREYGHHVVTYRHELFKVEVTRVEPNHGDVS